MTASKSEAQGSPTPNPGIPFDLEAVRRFKVDPASLQKRVAALETLKLPRGMEAVDPLLSILGAIDLTTLAGDDTASRVRHLCTAARSPLPRRLQKALGSKAGGMRVAAVCVFPAFVPEALAALKGSGVPVATVSAGFPHGLSDLEIRTREVRAAQKAGAQEIDVVIRREWALSGKWQALFEEIRDFRKAAGGTHLKVILGTGELEDPNRIARAALVALMGGADFVKTSTGKEKVNATLPAGLAMVEAMRRYEGMTGRPVGLKPAGGIRTAAEAYPWLVMVARELGEEAALPHRFRIGASSLLGDVLEQLWKIVGE